MSSEIVQQVNDIIPFTAPSIHVGICNSPLTCLRFTPVQMYCEQSERIEIHPKVFLYKKIEIFKLIKQLK